VIAVSIGSLLVASAAFLAHEIYFRTHPVFGWLTLLPLLAVIRIFSARTAGLCGAIWGAGLFCFLSLQAQPLVPTSIMSAAFLIGLPAVYAFVMVWVTRRFGFNPLILAFGWCGVELALLPLGLRGGLLGGIAGDSGSFLSLLQGLLGYVCMAALIVAVNAIALSMLTKAYAGACASQRYVRGSAGPRPRFIPRETPIILGIYRHAAQARAPPVFA
jgi:apolipoprotein N-acyltransferase